MLISSFCTLLLHPPVQLDSTAVDWASTCTTLLALLGSLLTFIRGLLGSVLHTPDAHLADPLSLIPPTTTTLGPLGNLGTTAKRGEFGFFFPTCQRARALSASLWQRRRGLRSSACGLSQDAFGAAAEVCLICLLDTPKGRQRQQTQHHRTGRGGDGDSGGREGKALRIAQSR